MARWRLRPGGLFTLGATLGLLVGRHSADEVAARALAPARLGDQLLEVGSPVTPPRPRRPLRPVAARALRQVAPELRLLLEPTDAEHEGADTDYLEYYRAELSPRLRAEDLAIDDRDVVDVGDGEHLVVLGTWRDTSFCHDLWFVAGLERTHAGTYRVVLFRKLRAPVAALRAIDLDRDGRAEVVLRTLFGEPGDGPAWHVHVVSRGWTGWTCSDLASSGQIRLLDEGSLFVDGSRAWTWSSQGFTTSSNNR